MEFKIVQNSEILSVNDVCDILTIGVFEGEKTGIEKIDNLVFNEDKFEGKFNKTYLLPCCCDILPAHSCVFLLSRGFARLRIAVESENRNDVKLDVARRVNKDRGNDDRVATLLFESREALDDVVLEVEFHIAPVDGGEDFLFRVDLGDFIDDRAG